MVGGQNKPLSVLNLLQEGGQVAAKLPHTDTARRGSVRARFRHGFAPSLGNAYTIRWECKAYPSPSAAATSACRHGRSVADAGIGAIAPELLDRPVPAAAVAIVPVADGVPLAEVLVVVFRGPELRRTLDGRDDRPPEFRLGLYLLRLRAHRLALVQRIDGGRIGKAPVAELAAAIRRVGRAEEDADERGKGDPVRIEFDADHFAVPAPHIGLIGGIGALAAGIAGDRFKDARHRVEVALDAPEAAAGKDRILRFCRPRGQQQETSDEKTEQQAKHRRPSILNYYLTASPRVSNHLATRRCDGRESKRRAKARR
ncbi:hypothetical protein EMEDMD4_370064 [Sinorhizobium medicae]|uniref:Uncharacterized protein n=1 Tax=Sinorhizobium medicae TaxID=110321 RepID=A0A508WZQ8_9HYPH|nr:hypothetical protein EMEDMD4_370064 [Sinorhizobium medicae]